MRVRITIFLVLFLFTSIIEAQTSEDSDQPKVGLVLSGGGAKGFAHIGALKVIDSLGIKIDYVAGTSMGAIIGGLYAAGYSGQDLDSIFEQINIEDLVNDVLPRSSRTFYERDIAERYAVTLPFNDFQLSLPSALSRGQNVYGLLNKLTLHVKDIENFENLPIPFFAMATNAETGDAVLLDNGNLALAMRASGSLPSLFQPVHIDDKVLIDGGVVNNYPIDELRAKGMDKIIGVDVQDGLASIEDMDSALDVLVQVNNFRTIKAMKEKREKTDIYIKPDINDFTVLSFSEGRRIIESGGVAAREELPALQELPKYQGLPNKHDVEIPVNETVIFNDIEIQGNDRYSRAYILGKLKIKSDEYIAFEDFREGVNNLLATNNFDLLYYDFKESFINDRYDLTLTVEESKVTTFLKFGVHYDDLYKSAA
ncbi:MAG: patatin-like phospholipase family protein, partial [Flavobacteriaceae bacterium]|nr:patatin-like phospholipase family protein [Flavobacteriaceae bacterium]